LKTVEKERLYELPFDLSLALCPGQKTGRNCYENVYLGSSVLRFPKNGGDKKPSSETGTRNPLRRNRLRLGDHEEKFPEKTIMSRKDTKRRRANLQASYREKAEAMFDSIDDEVQAFTLGELSPKNTGKRKTAGYRDASLSATHIGDDLSAELKEKSSTPTGGK